MPGDASRWLDGGRFETRIDRSPDDVWDYLLTVERTPQWRTHLGTVSWADDAEPRVGSRIDVTTSLLWSRNVRMVCEVTRLDRDAGVFAYRVVEGSAIIENEYRVTPAPEGTTAFAMQGRVLLDRPLIRLTAPMFRFAAARLARREVRQLRANLEATAGSAAGEGHNDD